MSDCVVTVIPNQVLLRGQLQVNVVPDQPAQFPERAFGTDFKCSVHGGRILTHHFKALTEQEVDFLVNWARRSMPSQCEYLKAGFHRVPLS